MKTLADGLAPWANLDTLAIDYRFPYAVVGPTSYIGYLALFDRYADSELGVHHGGQVPRFIADFGYDEEHGYRQMIEDLGFYAHARDHMQSASAATDALFIREYSTNRLPRLTRWLPVLDIPVVRLVNPLHEVGENTSPLIADAVGGSIGDIAHGKKTSQHKVLESKIRKTIFSMLYADVPEVVMERVEAIASHSEDSPAHQTYLWGHDLEASQTANIAARRVLAVLDRGGPFDNRFDKLTQLALQVGARTCRALVPGAQHYNYIKDTLDHSTAFFEYFGARVQSGV